MKQSDTRASMMIAAIGKTTGCISRWEPITSRGIFTGSVVRDCWEVVVWLTIRSTLVVALSARSYGYHLLGKLWLAKQKNTPTEVPLVATINPVPEPQFHSLQIFIRNLAT